MMILVHFGTFDLEYLCVIFSHEHLMDETK